MQLDMHTMESSSKVGAAFHCGSQCKPLDALMPTRYMHWFGAALGDAPTVCSSLNSSGSGIPKPYNLKKANTIVSQTPCGQASVGSRGHEHPRSAACG